MRDFFEKLQSWFQRYWQRLSGQQRIFVSLFSVIILLSVIATAFYMGRPEYTQLFSNLTAEDASSIVTKLKEQKVLFQIADNGRSIRVPAKEVYEIRLALASEGLPQGGSMGFEIFDKSFFGMSDFNQKLNYQRALQGELERTIRQIVSVDNARVHLVMPEKELYADNQKECTASVILKLKPGAQLTKTQVKAIVNLVRTSVEGLKENSISIIDTNGSLLSRPFEEDANSFASEAVSSHFELKKMVERNIEQQVLSMLEMILGPGKAVVRATVDLDLAKKESTSESYTPIAEDKENGVIRSQQKKTEFFKGSGTSQGAGVPGTASNVGGAPGYPQGGGSGSNSDYTKDESVTNYEINKKVEHQVSSPGEIKRLSLSVLVDGSLSPEKKTTLTQAVSSGIGLNTQRGDQIVVEGVEFDKTYIEQEKVELEKMNRREVIYGGVKTASIIFVTLVVLLFMVSMLKHAKVMKKTADEIRKTQEIIPAMMPQAALPPEEVAEAPVPKPAKLEPEIRSQIEDYAREKPQKFAEALREWLSSGT